MGVLINLRQLEKDDLELTGEVPVSELDINGMDELVHAEKPLEYELEAQKLEDGILVTGRLAVGLEMRVRAVFEGV